jgi:hypothetical protein
MGSGERVGKGASFKSVVEITGARRGERHYNTIRILIRQLPDCYSAEAKPHSC